jgi:DNA polymerase-3 subunit alpha
VIYQEQLMEIAKQMAGFSPAEADDLRKAVGKKKRALMAEQEDKFRSGLRESNTADNVAKDLWSLMTAAADYSFNRSHAACYALIAYRTAYLKANYPAEYMAALISSVMSTKDKVPFFVNRCEEMGVEVLPPDVNASDHGFVVSGNKIRFGLDAVKNVGHAAVQAIIAAREKDGDFASIWDFCERVDARAVNKRAIECLVKCGALDSTGATRKGMLEALPQALATGQKAQSDAQLGQGSIFELGGDAGGGAGGQIARPAHPALSPAEFDQPELLRMEKETLGTYVSSHPLSGIRDALRRRVDCSLAELRDREDRSMLTIGGLVGSCRRLRTRSGADMMFANLDDLEGSVEMLVFNQVLETAGEVIQPDRTVIVKGRLDHREGGRTSFVVQDAQAFEPTVTEIETARPRKRGLPPGDPLTLRILAADFQADLIEQLKSVFQGFPGETEVLLELETRAGLRKLRFGSQYRVDASTGLMAELDSLLGPDALAA